MLAELLSKLFSNMFKGYGPLNLFLIMGVIVSLASHNQVFTYVSVGLLLPLLDWTDTKPGMFSKTEVPSKMVWLVLMFILVMEAMFFYV